MSGAFPDWIRHPGFVRICQVVMGVVFVGSGLAKLGDLQAFAGQLHNFRLVPIAAENVIAFSLPWIEVVAGLALILKIQPRSGAWVVTGLLAIFTLGVITAMARGLSFECGCFGKADSSRVGLVKLLQNAGMLLLAAIGTLRTRSRGV